MASQIAQIVETRQLAGSAALLYSSPSLISTQITALTAANTDSAPHAITLYIVPAGGSAAKATITTPARVIPAGGTYNGQNEYGQVLGPGDALWGFADTASQVNILASGIQVTM